MVDFSGVFPAITRQFLAVNDGDLSEITEAHSQMRFARRQPVSGPNRFERRRHRPQLPRRSTPYQTYPPSGPVTEPDLISDMPELWSRPTPQAPQGSPYLGAIIGYLRRSKLGGLIPAWMLINLAILVCVTVMLAYQAVPAAIRKTADSCQWYVVNGNDTIYSISAAYNVDVTSVASANHLKSYGAIHPGQRLCIPAGVRRLIPEIQDALQTPKLI